MCSMTGPVGGKKDFRATSATSPGVKSRTKGVMTSREETFVRSHWERDPNRSEYWPLSHRRPAPSWGALRCFPLSEQARRRIPWIRDDTVSMAGRMEHRCRPAVA